MFETIIGIEVHCELKTQSKMFSSAPVSFGQPPNSQTHVIDLAMPGTLPSVKKQWKWLFVFVMPCIWI